ncbi:MAG: hypothetical protein ACJ762_06320 [Solirubrobacteraceae bacterium]
MKPMAPQPDEQLPPVDETPITASDFDRLRDEWNGLEAEVDEIEASLYGKQTPSIHVASREGIAIFGGLAQGSANGQPPEADDPARTNGTNGANGRGDGNGNGPYPAVTLIELMDTVIRFMPTPQPAPQKAIAELRQRLGEAQQLETSPDWTASSPAAPQDTALYAWALATWQLLDEHFTEYARAFYGEHHQVGAGSFAEAFAEETRAGCGQYLARRIAILDGILRDRITPA